MLKNIINKYINNVKKRQDFCVYDLSSGREKSDMRNEEKYPVHHLYCVFNFLTIVRCC